MTQFTPAPLGLEPRVSLLSQGQENKGLPSTLPNQRDSEEEDTVGTSHGHCLVLNHLHPQPGTVKIDVSLASQTVN
jgi:hypothetical protein